MDVGQTLVGAKGRYRLTNHIQGLHHSTVFKAEVLPGDKVTLPAKWVLIKTASPDDELVRECLKREYDAYHTPSIIASTNFRALYDIIGDAKDLDRNESYTSPCLVLEWLDCTLREVPAEIYRRNSVLLEAIMNAGLSSLVTLNKEKLVHTDLKPENILLSDIGTDHPTVKIGDLGLIRPDPVQGPAQPLAMRAPEVYRGLGCSHLSEVWAFAATLFCWIKPGVFGTPRDQFDLPSECWCIAKLMLLFPGWTGPPDDDDDKVRQYDFSIAKHLTVEPDPDKPDEKLVKVSSLEDEMQNMGLEMVLIDLFRYLFVVNPEARPSATEALASKEYSALKRAAVARAQIGD